MENRVNNGFDKDTSFRTLEIVNSWITAADNKSSILLAFVGLVVGLSANMYGQVTNYLVNGTVFEITLIILLGLLYLSILGLTIANLAFVFIARTKNRDIFSQNLVSFVSISDMDNKDYIQEAKKVDEITLCEMILSQVAINSKIAKSKMKYFNNALKFGLLLVPITIILVALTY